MRENFFKTLKSARELSKYTQQQMAELLKITIKQYQKYEVKTIPPHEKLFRLNEILSTDLSRSLYQQKVPRETDGDAHSETFYRDKYYLLLEKIAEEREQMIIEMKTNKEHQLPIGKDSKLKIKQ